MKKDQILLKAKRDINSLKENPNESSQILIHFILNIISNKCGVYVRNQLVKEMNLESKIKVDQITLN